MNLFGKKKAAPPPPQPAAGPPAVTTDTMDTIKMLRENLDTLEKRGEHVQKRIEAALQEAKTKAAKKDKNGAMFALKRKKMYEAEVSKLEGARISLESQISALESANVNMSVFRAMAQGAKTMKKMRGDMDADAVEDMMDTLQEEKEIQDSIAEAISRPAQDLYDDDELAAELDELMLEEAEPAAAAPVAAPRAAASVPSYSLPVAPTGAIRSPAPVAESEDERALRELQASMLA